MFKLTIHLSHSNLIFELKILFTEISNWWNFFVSPLGITAISEYFKFFFLTLAVRFDLAES
jgi:hypothetical protein